MLNLKTKHNSFHVQTMSRDQLSARLQQLATDGAALYERAERGEQMTARDLAQAIEYNQQYVDILAEMEDIPLDVPALLVTTEGATMRLESLDTLAEWITGVWNHEQ